MPLPVNIGYHKKKSLVSDMGYLLPVDGQWGPIEHLSKNYRLFLLLSVIVQNLMIRPYC